MSHCEHTHDHCQITTEASNVFQSLDELEFERGIWSAAQSGDLNKVISLLNKGEDIDVRDTAGYTALHYAARNGRVDICKYLLTRNANVNATTKAGCATPLHRACSAGFCNIVKLLLQYNADVQLIDSDGKTALHRAAETQNREISEELLAISPDLKFTRDLKNNVPADYANDEILHSLLKY